MNSPVYRFCAPRRLKQLQKHVTRTGKVSACPKSGPRAKRRLIRLFPRSQSTPGPHIPKLDWLCLCPLIPLAFRPFTCRRRRRLQIAVLGSGQRVAPGPDLRLGRRYFRRRRGRLWENRVRNVRVWGRGDVLVGRGRRVRGAPGWTEMEERGLWKARLLRQSKEPRSSI